MGTKPNEMKAHVLEAFGTPYVLRSLKAPRIQEPFDVIVKVEAASYCHTDELLRTGRKRTLPQLPFVGCHEVAGTVTAVGAQVVDRKPGDRVGVLTKGFRSCGQCDECGRPDDIDDDPGYSVYCHDAEEIGLTVGGGFSEYTLVDSRQTCLVPAGMTSVEAAPFMCAGVSMYAALQRCRLAPGSWVTILGAGGGLGHLGVQFAHHMGYSVLAVEAADKPLQLASEVCPPAVVVDARTTTAAQAKKLLVPAPTSRPSGAGADAVIVLTESQSAFEYGIETLKNGGLCMLVSFPENGYHLDPLIPISRGIKIVGSVVGSAKSLQQMMVFAKTHDIRSRSQVYSFTDLNQLVQDSHHSVGGKYVLDFSL